MHILWDRHWSVSKHSVVGIGRVADSQYGEPDAINNAISYATFFSRSYDAVICVYDETGNVIKTHEHAGDFKE
jgi:hypothetical protein